MSNAKPSPQKGPSLEGSLRERSCEQLFAYVEDRALTGSLVFTLEGVGQGVFAFARGRLVRAATRAPFFLSGILHELGRLETEDVNAALLAISKSGALFGDEVVRRGLVSREVVDEAIDEQLTRKLSSISLLPDEARFAYYHGVDLLTSFGRDDVPVSVARGVMRGLRAKGVTPSMREALERIGEPRVVSLWAPSASCGIGEVLVDLELTDEELQVAVDCVEPVSLALVRAHRDPKIVDRLLFGLFLLRRLRVGGVKASGQHAAVQQGTTSLTFRAPTSLADAQPALRSGVRPRAGAPQASPLPIVVPPPKRSITPVASAAPVPPALASASRIPAAFPPALLDARALLRAARAQATRGAFHESLQTLESLRKQATELDPEVETLYAWSLANVGHDPESTKRARLLLSRVLVNDPTFSQAYYYFALLERREGRFPLALKYLKKAIEMDPQNLDALRELRLFNMRVERGATPERAMSPAGGTPAVRGPISGLTEKLRKK